MSNRRRTLLIGGSSLIILVLLGLLLQHYFSSPASGVVEAPEPTSNTKVTSFDSTPVVVAGTYGQFSVPRALSTQPVERPVAPILESHSWTYPDTTSWRLGVTVTDVSNTAHAYSTSYQLRLDHPEQYVLTQQTVGNSQFNIMTDTSLAGFNKVAYQTRSGREVQISLYGNGPNSGENLTKTFDLVLSTWQWR